MRNQILRDAQLQVKHIPQLFVHQLSFILIKNVNGTVTDPRISHLSYLKLLNYLYLGVQHQKDQQFDKQVCVICSILNDFQDIDLHSMRGILTSIRLMNSIIPNTQTELVITFLGLRGIHLFGCSKCRKKAASMNLCAHDARYTY